uniref:Uncharacterized protein n=1 Tax=Arundo donax TaxID=35708 RepID=A0A0A9AEG5_ARUDO
MRARRRRIPTPWTTTTLAPGSCQHLRNRSASEPA